MKKLLYPNDLIVFLLCYALSFTIDSYRYKQMVRLFVITCTFILISQYDKPTRLLSFNPLVYIGNISYAVYLAHWPLYELYKYSNVQVVAYDREMPLESEPLFFK